MIYTNYLVHCCGWSGGGLCWWRKAWHWETLVVFVSGLNAQTTDAELGKIQTFLETDARNFGQKIIVGGMISRISYVRLQDFYDVSHRSIQYNPPTTLKLSKFLRGQPCKPISTLNPNRTNYSCLSPIFSFTTVYVPHGLRFLTLCNNHDTGRASSAIWEV